MAKKVRGHRANKPNDSFGTIGSETLYRGKYKEEVYQEDDEETTEVEAQAEEPETEESNESFVETKKESSDHDCLLYTSPSPRDLSTSRMPSSA